MRALWRTALVDLRQRRLQTLMLFVVVAIAAVGITAGLGQQRSAAERWDEAFASANGPHVVFYGDRGALDRVAAAPEVVQAAGPVAVTTTLLRHAGREFEDFELRAATAQRPKVGIPLLLEGRWVAAAGQVVVGRAFALAEGIEPGDRVALQPSGGGAPLRLRVVGTALDLSDCFYPECDSQMGWAAPATVARLTPEDAAGASVLLVRIAHPQAVGAFIARAKRIAGTGIHDLEYFEDTRRDALNLNRFFGGFLAAFGAFLLVAAGIVILSAVSARVLARYRELGILKALGFTPRALTALVLVENLAIAGAGAAAGVVAGGLLAPSLQLRMSSVLERGHATFPPGVLAGAVVTVLAIVTAATLLPAVRAGRTPASQAIARGGAPVSTRPSRLAGLAARARLGPAVAVAIKDVTSRPLRTWLTIATLVVTSVAIVAALAFDRTVQGFADNPALAGDPQALTVDPREVEPSEVAKAIGARPDVQASFTATERQVAVGDESFQVSVLGGDVTRAGYVVREGRAPSRPDETMIGYGLQERLGLGVGDTMPLAFGERTVDMRIVGRYAETDDDGERAIITLAGLRRVEPGADPGQFMVRVTPGADPAATARAIEAAAPGVRATVEEVDLGAFDAFKAAFYLIAALVLAVALANLVGTTALTIRERLRDIAILKALGFTPRQVSMSIALGAALLAAAALAIGVPLGLLAADAMLTNVGNETGIGPELGLAPATLAVALAALAIVALSAAVGALAARGAASAPVAEVLRSE
ncbi:MAG: FtsX-like permease family protein [Nocardioidaceae bacterium]